MRENNGQTSSFYGKREKKTQIDSEHLNKSHPNAKTRTLFLDAKKKNTSSRSGQIKQASKFFFINTASRSANIIQLKGEWITRNYRKGTERDRQREKVREEPRPNGCDIFDKVKQGIRTYSVDPRSFKYFSVWKPIKWSKSAFYLHGDKNFK